MQRVKSALDLTQSKYLPHVQRFSKALECISSEIAILEKAAHKAMRNWCDHHRVRLGDRLQPRGKVSGFADCRVLLRHAFAHEVADHGYAGGNADAGLERNTGSRGAYAVDDGEPSAHRPLGIVLMRSRIPKVSEHPIAEILRHHAI